MLFHSVRKSHALILLLFSHAITSREITGFLKVYFLIERETAGDILNKIA